MLLSRRAYAMSRKVDEKTVRKAIAAGKIRLVNGLIDPDIADADWLRNRDQGQQSKLAAAAQPTLLQNPSPAPSAPVQGPLESSGGSNPEFEIAPLTAARIRNTEESTSLKELTRRRLERELLEAEEVEQTWGQAFQILKDKLMLFPDDLAPALAASSEEAECRSLLMRAVLEVLAGMSKGVEDLAA